MHRATATARATSAASRQHKWRNDTELGKRPRQPTKAQTVHQEKWLKRGPGSAMHRATATARATSAPSRQHKWRNDTELAQTLPGNRRERKRCRAADESADGPGSR